MAHCISSMVISSQLNSVSGGEGDGIQAGLSLSLSLSPHLPYRRVGHPVGGLSASKATFLTSQRLV